MSILFDGDNIGSLGNDIAKGQMAFGRGNSPISCCIIIFYVVKVIYALTIVLSNVTGS